MSTPAPDPRSRLAAHETLDQALATGLRNVFKVLANENRLRILHALVAADELCVGDIAAAAGMTAQAVSNQLQRLVDQGILAARRDGQHVYYRVVDPCVPDLMDLGVCLVEEGARRRGGDPPPGYGAPRVATGSGSTSAPVQTATRRSM